MTNILVLSPDAGEAEKYRGLLESALPQDVRVHAGTSTDPGPRLADAEILFGWKYPPELIARASALRWVHKISAGVEDVVGACRSHPSARLTRTDGIIIAPRMVEYVLAAVFVTSQNLMRAVRQQAERRWASYAVGRASGQTIGVAGLGDIGLEIARSLHRNGMRVLGWRRSMGPPPDGVERVYAGNEELAAFVSECAFVVSVLPATAETDRIFNADVFAAMRPDATFINVGRGLSVDEDALAQALASGQLAGAVLDVFRTEPLPATSPLWSSEKVIITPHVSGPIIPEDVVPFFVENFRSYRAGKSLLREVDLARGY